METLLSIAILTMNRKEKLINALQSCIACKLPYDTEFIIIDNGSINKAENEVRKLFSNISYKYHYHYYKENIGVGEGRNYAYKLSNSRYLFFLDDDAVIDEKCRDYFFSNIIEYMNNNTNIAMITTNIYDEALISDRKARISKNKIGGKFLVYAIQGGSFLIRSNIFKDAFHPDIKYGSEDIYPSIIALDKGFYNVFIKDLNVIHKPAINKWTKKDDISIGIIEMGNANLYALRSILYPSIFKPCLFFAFYYRYLKYLRKYKGSYKRSLLIYKQAVKNNKKYTYKIKYKTVFKIIKNFGIGAAF